MDIPKKNLSKDATIEVIIIMGITQTIERSIPFSNPNLLQKNLTIGFASMFIQLLFGNLFLYVFINKIVEIASKPQRTGIKKRGIGIIFLN